ncbi:PAS domain-containing sensor histidine kinase [Poseidonocella sedimentorum]|uniref:histidine kinase n=1 Tax=Poseidonocella sedimentorum TaxID=871652 RepID=A0A1I6DDK1_9RHOB|nr:PAS domain-containing sensor histidine kinase [Poseidonocella sedimentorum]SFR03431.1 PAS domain S-box-containing protein [Poseidonocella sedimentorum]
MTLRQIGSYLPALALSIAIPLGVAYGVPVPAGFLLLLCAVIGAGIVGGRIPATLAGLTASAVLAYAHHVGFGPAAASGLSTTAFAMLIYTATGHIIGTLRDQRDETHERLRRTTEELEERLREESAALEASARILNVSEVQLDQAARIAKLGYFVVDARAGICTVCSKRHAEIFGLTAEDFIARTNSGIAGELPMVHPDDRAKLRAQYERLLEGSEIDIEYRFPRADGTEGNIREFVVPYFDEAGQVVRGIGSSIDMTEARRTEERLLHSQKMDAVGKLTGGVAHDFNNLLAVILGNLELIESEIHDHPALRKELDAAKSAVRQGADLIHNMLSFAQQARLEPRRLDLGAMALEVEKWAVRVLPAQVSLEVETEVGLWEVMADASASQSALLNLIVNARDAMPEGGEVLVETANVTVLEPHDLDGQGVLAPGRYVRLSVSDSGVGMAPERLKEIFEPFFTTKRPGQGSGLGLSMVQGFMSQTGGVVHVQSALDKGTRFSLYFPAAELQRPVAGKPQSRAALTPSSGIRILMVEDEAAVRELLTKMLTRAGYHPVPAASGDEAVKLWQTAGPFDLLLTDIMMPGRLQGPELAELLRKSDPGLRVLFLSGQSLDFRQAQRIRDAGVPDGDRLMKPVSRETLIRGIETALQAPADARPPL